MYIDKYVSIRPDIPIKNIYSYDYDKNSYDFHMVIYIIDIRKIKVIVRRLDNELGWIGHIKLSLYSIDLKNKQSISIPSSKENYYILETDVKMDIKPIDLSYFQNIPKVIIQTARSNDMTLGKYNSIQTILELNPEYEYHFFDDQDCRKFIKENFNLSILNAYDVLIPGAYKADLFRYCYLYINGGIYIDCKKICKQPFRDFIKRNDDYVLVKDIKYNAFYNAFMCMVKENIQLLRCINEIKLNTLNKTYNEVLMVTGPQLLYKHFKTYVPKLKNKKMENINTHHKTAIVSQTNEIIIYDYKTYYEENYVSYSQLFNKKQIYYEGPYIYDKYTIYVYPIKINGTPNKFKFEITDGIITTEADKKWHDDLKIKLIDNETDVENEYNLGHSDKNNYVSYKFENMSNQIINKKDNNNSLNILVIILLIISFVIIIDNITKLK